MEIYEQFLVSNNNLIMFIPHFIHHILKCPVSYSHIIKCCSQILLPAQAILAIFFYQNSMKMTRQLQMKVDNSVVSKCKYVTSVFLCLLESMYCLGGIGCWQTAKILQKVSAQLIGDCMVQIKSEIKRVSSFEFCNDPMASYNKN